MATQLLAAVETGEIVTEFIRSMIRLSDSPTQVFVGIYNAFANGQILTDIGIDFNDKQLENFYDGLDLSLGTIRKMEGV